MVILLGCMAGEIGVEGDEFNGSYGLEGKQASTPSFSDAFFPIRAQNRPLQIFLQDVLVHLHDPLFSYRNRPKG